jgi:hypothetical protein
MQLELEQAGMLDQGAEVATPPRTPRGLLTRGLWGALTKFYPVGDDGGCRWVEVYDLDGSTILGSATR